MILLGENTAVWVQVPRNVSEKFATKLAVKHHEGGLEVILLFIPP